MPPGPRRTAASDFDALAMFAAIDARRAERGLSWRQVADEVWDQSARLNQWRRDHPISPSTITGIAKRGDCTCQHALFLLRWLGRAPESFIAVPRAVAGDTSLPSAGPDRRPRWSLAKLYEALNSRRQERQLTWKALARELRCSESQLTGIRTARFAIGMTLAMRIVQWLEHPAASFIDAARW
jgi:hypothetical protein